MKRRAVKWLWEGNYGRCCNAPQMCSKKYQQYTMFFKEYLSLLLSILLNQLYLLLVLQNRVNYFPSVRQRVADNPSRIYPSWFYLVRLWEYDNDY